MKRKIVTIMAMMIILSVFAACSQQKETTRENAVDVSVDDVVSKIKSVNPVTDERAIDDFALENEMGLKPDDIVEYKGVITNSQNDCSLIFVAKAKEGKTREIKQALSDYLAGLSANDLYAEFADKIEKTKQAKVLVYDDYVVLVIAGLDVDNNDVVKAVNEAFGE